MNNICRELRRVWSGTSVPGMTTAAKALRCGRVEEQPAVTTATQTAPGSPSLHPPSSPTSERGGSERRTWLCPRAEPTTANPSPTNPTGFARPQNIPAPPPCCCSFILFLDLLLLLALFYLFLVLIIPGSPQCFAFPPQPSSGCFFSLLVFSAFPRILLPGAGQRSGLALGKGSHGAGLAPDHHLETPAWSRRGEALGLLQAGTWLV